MDLTYELVDDLSFAAQGGRARLHPHLAETRLSQLGPLVEYAWLRRRLSLPSLTMGLGTPLSENFRRFALSPGNSRSESLNDGSTDDFAQIPSTDEGFGSVAWVTFLSRMQFAAQVHGFTKEQSAGLAGALGEMASNAREHSKRAETAIAAFRTAREMFEFVVADAGIGATASLRSCPEFQHVHDAGVALTLCISEGVSRYGRAKGHGLGFQVLFARLADFNARVRIRSDDQVIDLRGDRPGKPVTIPAGRTPMVGFIVSAQCFPPV